MRLLRVYALPLPEDLLTVRMKKCFLDIPIMKSFLELHYKDHCCLLLGGTSTKSPFSHLKNENKNIYYLIGAQQTRSKHSSMTIIIPKN